MRAADQTVTDFNVVGVPCVHFSPHEKKAERKQSAKAYDTKIRFADETEITDRMEHLDYGQARHCYKVLDLPMVLKWFHETDDVRYKSLHPGELRGFQQVSHLPCAVRSPAMYAIKIQRVINNWHAWMNVDWLIAACPSMSVQP